MPTSPTLRSMVFVHRQVGAVRVREKQSAVWRQAPFVSTTLNSPMGLRLLLGFHLSGVFITSQQQLSILALLITPSFSNCSKRLHGKPLTSRQSGVQTRKWLPEWSIALPTFETARTVLAAQLRVSFETFQLDLANRCFRSWRRHLLKECSAFQRQRDLKSALDLKEQKSLGPPTMTCLFATPILIRIPRTDSRNQSSQPRRTTAEVSREESPTAPTSFSVSLSSRLQRLDCLNKRSHLKEKVMGF